MQNLETEYTVATLPGMSPEEIVIMTHTDGYFQAATDNAAGMASALEIVRVYTRIPGKRADLDKPFTVRRGGTVRDVARLVHKDIASSLKFARLCLRDTTFLFF